MSIWLYDRKFYDLMQAYRTAPAENQVMVQESFDVVRAAIKENENSLRLLVFQFMDATKDMNGDKIAAAHEEARKLGL